MDAASETSLKSDNHNKNIYLAQVVQRKCCGQGHGAKRSGFAHIGIYLKQAYKERLIQRFTFFVAISDRAVQDISDMFGNCGDIQI